MCCTPGVDTISPHRTSENLTVVKAISDESATGRQSGVKRYDTVCLVSVKVALINGHFE
jgi:hypothetical protein